MFGVLWYLKAKFVHTSLVCCVISDQSTCTDVWCLVASQQYMHRSLVVSQTEVHAQVFGVWWYLRPKYVHRCLVCHGISDRSTCTDVWCVVVSQTKVHAQMLDVLWCLRLKYIHRCLVCCGISQMFGVLWYLTDVWYVVVSHICLVCCGVSHMFGVLWYLTDVWCAEVSHVFDVLWCLTDVWCVVVSHMIDVLWCLT